MIRSLFPLRRIFLWPFAVLLAIYLVVVGGGGLLLMTELRQTESRLLIDRLLSELKPVAAQLSEEDALSRFGESNSRINNLVEGLFNSLPALAEVSIRDRRGGFVMSIADGKTPTTLPTGPLTEGMDPAAANPHVGSLHTDNQELFLIRYRLMSSSERPKQLEFGFNRKELQSIVRSAMDSLKNSVLLFAMVGSASILVALGIAIYAGRQVRRLESYHQEIYRRAYLTEIGASLVHELRNPLAAIRSNIKALLVSPEQTREIVAELDREIMALSDKLTGFLSLTREDEESFRPVDVEAVVREAVRLAEPVMNEKNLRVEVDMEQAIPPPVAQEKQLRDALLNLLINAAHSGQKEGAVAVRVRTGSAAVIIEVEDRGEGIPPESMARIFDPFYTTRPDGNGLGLAIVKRIIDNHQGDIHAENLRRGGVRFSIALPLQQINIPKWWKALKAPSRT